MDTGDLPAATMVVTGGNTGIGLETAVGLAGRGVRVVITARDPERGASAVAAIRQRTGSDRVDVLPLDLASFDSIRSFATMLLDRYDRLDVLINNAGLAPDGRRWETAEGFEAAFGVNHLGHALLTHLLLDRLGECAPSRVVVVSSGAYRMAGDGICFHDLQHEGEFHSLGVYAESKLANIYYTLELAERLEGSGVTVNALNPGHVASRLGQTRPEDLARATVRPQVPHRIDEVLGPLPEPVDPAVGARTSVFLATSPEVEGVNGSFFSRCRAEPLTRLAGDREASRRLWDESERLIAGHPGRGNGRPD